MAGTYLDCGCHISPEGERTWCPTCMSEPAEATPEPAYTEAEVRERERRAWEGCFIWLQYEYDIFDRSVYAERMSAAIAEANRRFYPKEEKA